MKIKLNKEFEGLNEQNLARLSQEGYMDARFELVLRNYGYIYSQAGIVGRGRDYDTRQDLISEALILGFESYAKRFEPRGFKFISYIGKNLLRDLFTYGKRIDSNGRERIEEIPLRIDGRYKSAAKPNLSGSHAYEEGWNFGFVEETIPDINQKNPDEVLEEKEILRYLEEAKEHLSDLERNVLNLYFDEDLSLERIGDILRLSRERTRQIKEKALRKLSHPGISRKLISSVEGTYCPEGYGRELLVW